MEVETGFNSAVATPEGEPVDDEGAYVSPDVAAARAGETVDFSKSFETDTDDA